MLLSGLGDTLRVLARVRGLDAVLVIAFLAAILLLLLLSDPALGYWTMALEPGGARP
jgi:hypothetical protein